MELDLKEFSLTLAVGVAVAGVSWLALRCAWANGARKVFDLILQKGDSMVVPLLIGTVVFLAIGMIVEDLSKNALAERDPAAFAPQFQRMMPSERYDRSQVLTSSEYDTSMCRHPLPEGIDDSRSVQFMYSSLGEDLRHLLADINMTGAATSEEVSALASLRNFEATLVLTPVPLLYETTCKNFVEGLSPLYYLAKNHVFREDNYFKELQSLSVRFEFARSLCYVLLAGAYLVIVLYLAQNTVTMWRDIGGSKTAISIALAIVVLIAAFDVIVFLPSKDVAAFLGLSGAIAIRVLDKTRVWILPATFLFVCLYRTRRLWPRLGKTIKVSIDSTIPDPPILRNYREWDARNAILSVLLLALLAIPVGLAYQSDHNAFLKRVYAYYVVVRGDATVVVPPARP